jgi:predicted PurR-regulated permease PerM
MHDVNQLRRFEVVRTIMVLLLGAFGLVIIKPLLGSLVGAGILSILCMPMRHWLLVRIPNHQHVLPLLIMLAGSGLFIGPVLWLVLRAQDEASLAYQLLPEGLSLQAIQFMDPLKSVPLIGPLLMDALKAIPTEAHDLILAFRQFLPALGKGFGSIFIVLSDQVLQIFITGFALYFFLRDGPSLMNHLREGFFALTGVPPDAYFNIIESTVWAVSFGILGSALLQGLIATVGYFILGLQTPLLLGLLSAVLSLVPVVGAFLIWGPLVLFLLLQHEFATALGLSLWGILIIHPADNIFRPWVIGTMLHSPLLLIVLGVVGGILSMGLIGLFVGPCILSLLYHGWCDWASKAH